MTEFKACKKTINASVYDRKKAAGVSIWQIADELGVSDNTLYRKLRHQLQPDQEAEVLEAIRRAEIKVKAERSEVERE